MKVLIFIPLLITSVLSSYLSGLDRSFDKIEKKIVDLYVSMPEQEIENLYKYTQISDSQMGMGTNSPDFEFNNAGLVIKYNGKEKEFENVVFKTGGMNTRTYDKVGFNIKLPKKFLGRKNIRIRSDPSDNSHLRSKLCCDISNRLGLPSIHHHTLDFI